MNKPVSIDLGAMEDAARRYVAEGRFGSLDEVVRAGLEALARDEAGDSAWLREKIAEGDEDPRPAVSIDAAFERIRETADRRRR